MKRINKNGEDISAGAFALCFLMPVIGFLLYFSRKGAAPRRAKRYLSAAVSGLKTAAVIIYFLIIIGGLTGLL